MSLNCNEFLLVPAKLNKDLL